MPPPESIAKPFADIEHIASEWADAVTSDGKGTGTGTGIDTGTLSSSISVSRQSSRERDTEREPTPRPESRSQSESESGSPSPSPACARRSVQSTPTRSLLGMRRQQQPPQRPRELSLAAHSLKTLLRHRLELATGNGAGAVAVATESTHANANTSSFLRDGERPRLSSIGTTTGTGRNWYSSVTRPVCSSLTTVTARCSSAGAAKLPGAQSGHQSTTTRPLSQSPTCHQPLVPESSITFSTKVLDAGREQSLGFTKPDCGVSPTKRSQPRGPPVFIRSSADAEAALVRIETQVHTSTYMQ